VVEGYFDVIALHAVGITNVVASLGTALSLHQVKMLLRFTESRRLVFNFDADGAGIKATTRAIGNADNTEASPKNDVLETSVAEYAYQDMAKIHVLNLPNGKDSDEFLKTHNSSDYQRLVDCAPLWIDWQIQRIVEGQDLAKPGQLKSVTEAMSKLLGNITNSATRTDYIRSCAELLGDKKSWLVRRIEEDLRLQVKGQRWHGRSQRWQTLGRIRIAIAAAVSPCTTISRRDRGVAGRTGFGI
jgi:DNA primase